MKYKEFEKAVDVLGLITKTSKSKVKQRYKELSKKYHPDVSDENEEKFQEINKSYKIIIKYMDNFRFDLTKNEFREQYPFSDKTKGDWLYYV